PERMSGEPATDPLGEAPLARREDLRRHGLVWVCGCWTCLERHHVAHRRNPFGRLVFGPTFPRDAVRQHSGLTSVSPGGSVAHDRGPAGSERRGRARHVPRPTAFIAVLVRPGTPGRASHRPDGGFAVPAT